MEENGYNSVTGTTSSSDEVIKGATRVFKKISVDSLGKEDTFSDILDIDELTSNTEKTENSSNGYNASNGTNVGAGSEVSGFSGKIGSGIGDIGTTDTPTSGTKFKVCTSTALAKPSIWTKVKNTLLAEVKVELTPYQQKIENEINEFLHKEITWKSFKAFWTQEIKITL